MTAPIDNGSNGAQNGAAGLEKKLGESRVPLLFPLLAGNARPTFATQVARAKFFSILNDQTTDLLVLLDISFPSHRQHVDQQLRSSRYWS
jgi:hypothetical protein